MRVLDATSARAAERMLAAGRVAFAAGCGIGWLLRHQLLVLLMEPWREPGVIWEAYPSPSEVESWHLLTTVTTGTLLTLPMAAWLGWSLVAARSCPQGVRSVSAFLVWSYVALGLGLGLAVFVAYPAFVEMQRERWGGMMPVPWSFVTRDLRWIVDVAFLAQLLAILVGQATRKLMARALCAANGRTHPTT